jgi:O-antigen ligase
MSSTGNLTRTERGLLAEAFPQARVATIIAALLFTTVIMSFRPFQPAGAELAPEGGGDVVNQLGFSALGGLALFGLLAFVNPRVLKVFFSPWWLLLLGCFALSVLNAADPSAAARAALFTLIGILTIVAVLALPRDADSFCAMIGFAGIVILTVSYAGLVLLPNVAIHTTASAEPQHAGLWRGVFAHKNIAGPVMACFSFAGLYLFRRGWRWIGGLLFVAALIFMANTGSKTTAALVPMTFAVVVLPGLIGMRQLTVALCALALAGTGLATLGIVYIEPLKEFVHANFGNVTYTGRVTLWEFGGEMLAKRPWLGYGYDSFWGSRMLLDTDNPFDRPWDIRDIVHGHDGYLDIALTMGIPAVCVAVFTLLIEPLRDYLRIPHLKENIYLGDFFLMVLLFTALNGFLESFFFRRADPVWMFFVTAVLGLRLVARIPIRSSVGR